MNPKEIKEYHKQMCKCKHSRGEHAYIGSRCLRVMTCKCKGFKQAKPN